MSIQCSPQCCCGCIYKEFAIFICNCNNVTDDDLKITLNGHDLGTLDMRVGARQYPGAWWATDPTIPLAKLNEVMSFDGFCETTMGAARPLDRTFLMNSDTNKLGIQSVVDRFNGNFGCLWFAIYRKDGDKWSVCYKAENYAPATLGPPEIHNVDYFKNKSAKPSKGWTGPKKTT